MKKFFLSAAAALVGICLGIAVHCTFMIVEEQSSAMLPDIEPGQKVIIYLLAKNDEIQVGDIVAYMAPYYTVDGENGILLKRVVEVTSEDFILSSDVQTTEDMRVKVSKEEILGRVIAF